MSRPFFRAPAFAVSLVVAGAAVSGCNKGSGPTAPTPTPIPVTVHIDSYRRTGTITRPENLDFPVKMLLQKANDIEIIAKCFTERVSDNLFVCEDGGSVALESDTLYQIGAGDAARMLPDGFAVVPNDITVGGVRLTHFGGSNKAYAEFMVRDDGSVCDGRCG